MTEEEILEGNKLIAEFMGYESIYHSAPYDYFMIDGEGFRIDGLKFNTSWDWLMPVLDKIVNLPINDGIGETKQYSVVFDSIGYTKLEGLYSKIVDFIKWYNQNK